MRARCGASAGAIAAMLVPARAYAHHATGAAPRTAAEGLISGLAHPLLEPDHALFLIVAAALIATRWDRLAVRGPVGVVVGAVVGMAARLFIAVPGLELAIATTLLIGGALALAGHRAGAASCGPFLGIAAAVHGYAYAASIVGIGGPPLWAYVVGVATIQCLAVGAVPFFVNRLGWLESAVEPARARRAVGGAAILGGVLFVALA